MKEYSQLQKILAVLISFLLMIEFTGCYSTRIMSTSEINISDKYLIHAKKFTLAVDNVVISDGMLSGKINFTKQKHGDSGNTHIYLSSDSALKINDNLISLPVGSIATIEQKIPNPKKTALLTVLVVAGCLTAVGLIVFMVSAVKGIGNDVEDLVNYCTKEY